MKLSLLPHKSEQADKLLQAVFESSSIIYKSGLYFLDPFRKDGIMPDASKSTNPTHLGFYFFIEKHQETLILGCTLQQGQYNKFIKSII